MRSLGIASLVLRLKLQTLKVPAMPLAARIFPRSMPRWGKTLWIIPSASPIPIMSQARRYCSMGISEAKAWTSRVRQRSHISTGARPEKSIARLIVPPEVPSAGAPRTPPLTRGGPERDTRQVDRPPRGAVGVGEAEARLVEGAEHPGLVGDPHA